MLSRLERYKKAIAATLAALVGIGAHFVPAFAAIEPAAIQGAAALLSVAAVFAVPNTRNGQSVDFLAEVLVEIIEAAQDDGGDVKSALGLGGK